MLDRQDIDALLIGSLYGELSSTEEARLSAHLESHPADRTALANLSRAREVVRESRILQVQFEPPQSISALLMQEAVRRAPKPREEQGWFQRFMRSFLTHPAMAAAAMLVLIIGVAGTVYMRKGDHFANQTKEPPGALAPATESVPPSATPAEQVQEAQNELAKSQQQLAQGSAAGDNYRVQLDEGTVKSGEDKAGNSPALVAKPEPAANSERARDANVDGKKNKGTELAFDASERRDTTKIAGAKQDPDEASGYAQPPKAPAKTTAKPAAKPPRLEVTTPTQAPKDFESQTARGTGASKKLETDGVAGGGAGGATGSRAPGGAPSVADSRPAAPPPPPAPATPTAVEEREQAKPDPQLAWAKEQHGKVITAVKAGNCQTAANLAVQISNRAPAYYASNVETDRTIKQCMQYITAEREKEAERTRRMKATQRRAADEAPAPAKSSTK